MNPRFRFCLEAIKTLNEADTAELTDKIEAYVRQGIKPGQANTMAVDDLLQQITVDRTEIMEAVQALTKGKGGTAKPDSVTVGNQADKAKPEKADHAAKLDQAKADLHDALGDLADLFGAKGRLNFMPVEDAKLMPVLTRVLDAAFRMGYYKFKDAAKFSLDTIRAKIGDEVADAITLDHLQGAYIGMAGKYKDQGADTKRDVAAYDSLDEVLTARLTQPPLPLKIGPPKRRKKAMTEIELISKIRKHWTKWLPKRVASLKEQGLLEESIQATAKLAVTEHQALMSQGYRAHEADEVVLHQFVLLRPEVDAVLGAAEAAELAHLDAEHAKNR